MPTDREEDAKYERTYERADDAALFLTPTVSALLRAHWQRLTGTADDPPAYYMNEGSARIVDALAEIATETIVLGKRV